LGVIKGETNMAASNKMQFSYSVNSEDRAYSWASKNDKWSLKYANQFRHHI